MKCTQITSDQMGNHTYLFDDGSVVVGRAEAYQLGQERDDGKGHGVQGGGDVSSKVLGRELRGGGGDGGSGGTKSLSGSQASEPESAQGFRREETKPDASPVLEERVDVTYIPDHSPTHLESERPRSKEATDHIDELEVVAPRTKRKR